MMVLDASVVLEILLGTPSGQAAAERTLTSGAALHAPHLLDLEVLQVLRRYEERGDISGSRAREAISDLRDLPIRRHPHDVFADAIWSHRRNLAAYDAAYVVLAEALPAVLITRDARLSRSPGTRAQIELV